MTALAAQFAALIPQLRVLAVKAFVHCHVVPQTGNAAREIGSVMAVTFGAFGEINLAVVMPSGDGIWNIEDVAFTGGRDE